VVGVGQNPEKRSLFSGAERHDMLATLVAELCAEQPDHAPVDVQVFEGLTIDFARSVGATVLLRGIRNLSDLQAEVQQAVTNREVAGIESAFVVAGQNFAYTSSTLIRQIAAMGDDLSVLAPLCPKIVIDALREKKRQHPEALRIIEH
jgi:pantetheine-phosphate adenylyltransferase